MENIKSLNEKISRQVFYRSKEQSLEKEDIIDKYAAFAKTGALTKVCFDSCSPDGMFTTYDGDVLLILPGKNVGFSSASLDKYSAPRMIGVELSLKVKEIDRENRRVIFSMPASVTADTVRSAVSREIARTLERGNCPVVWGKIKKIAPTRITVDILNQGIIGFIDSSHWQKCYTRSLTGMCTVGDFLQFEILKAAPKKPGVPTAWVLSRKNITQDAWSLIDFEALKVDSSIVVECVERPIGKSYWWGTSDRVPGIEVMGDYTYRFQSGKTLLEGVRYVCKIAEVVVSQEDHKKNKFKVIPYEVYPEDAAKVSRYDELLKKVDYKKL